MKKYPVILLFAAILFGLAPACSKGGGGGGNGGGGGGGGTNEATLVVETTPANGTIDPPGVGPTFPLKVEIKSAMPTNGVKIDISAKKDGSSDPAFFTGTLNTTASQNNFTILNTPATVVCVVSVTVTSLTTSSNVWTGSYRYSKK